MYSCCRRYDHDGNGREAGKAITKTPARSGAGVLITPEEARIWVAGVALAVASGEELLLQAVPWGKKADKDP